MVPLSYALYSRARVYDAAALLDRTIEALGPEDAALAQGLEAQVIAWARFDERLYPMARERLARSAPEADAESDGGRFLLALAASELARAGESPDEARDLAQRALTDGLSRGEANWQRYMLSVAVLVTLDDVDAAVARFDDWLEDARRQGSLFAFSHASSFRGLAMLHRGELREAEADARAACEGVPLLRWHSFLHLAETLIERGELEEATRVIEHVAASEVDEPPTYQMARWEALRARLRILAGESERGLAELLETGERLEALGVLNPSYVPWRSQAALVLAGQGERGEATRLVEQELGVARAWQAPRALGAALRAAGLVAEGDGSIDLLRESVEVLAGSPIRLELAKSLTELGAALRRGNARADAREHLREGLELAERCGAAPLAERARTELLATGARPRRVMRTGVDSLTPSEHRVAGMAAGGQTNREIAQALFVTPKTVEMHLSHVYRKLGIRSRSQLQGALET